MIAKSLSTSQRYAQLHQVAGRRAEFCQALYPLLIAHADDFGRLAGDVFTVKHMVVPTSPRSEADVGHALEALQKVGLIDWYDGDGRKCIQIWNFDAHQAGLHKRTRSAFPEPSGKLQEIPSELKRREQKGTEQNGTEQNGTGTSRKRANVPPAVPGAPLIDQREHRRHAHCGRVCMHASLFSEFVRRRNHPDADREIRDWCLEVEREWASSSDEPGDSFKFWRLRYDERWPVAKTDKSAFGTWRPNEVTS
jgi:hypothetical protein